MAGHLYIRHLSTAQLTDLYQAGGAMVGTVFHCDRTYAAGSAILVAQENAAVQMRHGLPAHCYIEFQKNDTTQAKLQAINATLSLLTKPAGIVASCQALANWPGNGANAAADMLWTALQTGGVTVEFYQYENAEVRVSIPYNGHPAVCDYWRYLEENLTEVYEIV